jgi:hypothetical protein
MFPLRHAIDYMLQNNKFIQLHFNVTFVGDGKEERKKMKVALASTNLWVEYM